MGRGYIVTVDALIALSLVVFLTLGVIGMQHTENQKRGRSGFEALHESAENAIDTSNKQGVLEQIAYYWSVGNESAAGNLTKHYFDMVVPAHAGYRLEAVDGDSVHIIYSSDFGRPSEEDSRDQTKAERIISGYAEDAPRTGWISKAYLKETNIWDTNLIYEDENCETGLEQIVLSYDPTSGTIEDKVFYVRVEADASVNYAKMNVSWEQTETTTSSTSSTTTTTSTTTSIEIDTCHACPVVDNFCEVIDEGPWSTDGEGPSKYNYHKFTINSGGCDDVEIYIYSTYYWSERGREINQYDIFMNIVGDKCMRPPEPPVASPWEHHTWSGFDEFDLIKHISVGSLSAGTYTFMVDCFDNGGINRLLCNKDYYLWVNSSTPGCDIGVSQP
jgi:hypothetical protein